MGLMNSIIMPLSYMTFLRWLTFLLGSLTVTVTVLLFWIYLFLLILVFVLHLLSLLWEILIMLLSWFPLTFPQTQNGIPLSIKQVMTILVLIGIVLMIIWKMLHGRISFKVQVVETNVYISHCKYQIKPPSSLWFLAAFAAVMAHR